MDYRAGDLEAFRERSKRNFENRCLHQHVFDTHLAVEMVDHMGLQLLDLEAFRPMHIALIARKLACGQVPQNATFTGAAGTPVWRSPFPSDRHNQQGAPESAREALPRAVTGCAYRAVRSGKGVRLISNEFAWSLLPTG
jgi:hypothetical protein